MSTVKVKLPEKYAEEDDTGCYVPKRYILTVLSFLGMLNVYAMRVNLSVAMVAMVNNTRAMHWNSSNSEMECPNLISKSQSSETERFIGEQYNWSTREQGLILGAFFYGYIITQLPGGFLSEKFGAKWLFGGGCLVTAILTLITPVAASWGTVPFVIVRVLEGLGEGVTFPAMNLLISKWSPKLERSRVSTIIFTGNQIGNVISMPISGFLCSIDFMGGWPSAFYVFGIAGVIWFLFWAVLVYESPAEHPSISKKELKYFQVENEEISPKGHSKESRYITLNMEKERCLLMVLRYLKHNEIDMDLSSALHHVLCRIWCASHLLLFTDDTGCYVPKRYILTVLSFLGMLNVYAMRVNLSVAMVAMVNNTRAMHWNSSNSEMECPNLISKSQSSETERFIGEQYNWSTREQGLILGAFFYGYIITQLPGGFLSEKFGAKWLFGGGCLVTAILTLITPVAASWGTVPFVIVRVLEGLGEGVTFPAMNLLISKWSPKLERSRVSTIIFTGNQIGNVISMPISGFLCSIDFMGGWPSAFYVFGIAGVIWFLFWAVLVYESPAEHPSISKKELKYFQVENEEISPKKSKTPWKAIITSLPMWAVVVAHCGHNFGFLILLTELPTYLDTILHFDIKDNGSLSALPYIVQAITAWGASYIADRLRRSNVLSITNIRKLSNSIGLFGPAICLLCVTVTGCRPQLTIALFTLCMATNGFIYSGYNVTHVDMSPTFAGTLFAITNAISNLSGVIAPAIVGAFTSKGATIANWSDVFYIAAAVYTFTAAFYAAFASAELQPWGQGEKETDSENPLKDLSTIDSKS